MNCVGGEVDLTSPQLVVGDISRYNFTQPFQLHCYISQPQPGLRLVGRDLRYCSV